MTYYDSFWPWLLGWSLASLYLWLHELLREKEKPQLNKPGFDS
jgi:hypothetical protein